MTGKRALVVDDQKSIRMILRRTLEKEGVEVLEASNGMEALVHIGNGKFDVIFMDLHMPEISGEESIKEIIRLHPKSRIIVYSAFDDPDAQDHVRELGVSAVIEKPSSSFEILQTMKAVLEGEIEL